MNIQIKHKKIICISDHAMKGLYTTARVFVLRIRVLCAFPTSCTCVEFKLRMKRESTYFETHEYSLAALQRVSTLKYAFLHLANQIVLLQRSDANQNLVDLAQCLYCYCLTSV